MPLMEIKLEQGKANAYFKEMKVETGSGSPSPFDLFLVSLATCSALTAQAYCQKKGLPTQGFNIGLDIERHEVTRMATRVAMKVTLPEGFPAKEVDGLLAVANDCFVKKHLYTQPEFEMTVTE